MDQTTPSSFTLAPGEGDLPKITLTAPDGAQAEIYLHGAHVASWAPANDTERLFMSEASAFSAGAPIRGGIPLVFPQFGANGPLPNHGFARILPWEFLGAQVAGNTATAIFHLVDSPETRALWDHAFAAELSVAVGGNGLSVTLEIDNTGHEPFSFTTALHTYLRVADLAETYVQGLGDRTYRDLPAGGIEAVQAEPLLRFEGELGRLYLGAPAELQLFDGERTVLIRHAGFTDTVVWNPGAQKSLTFPDLKPDDYLHYVCVEGATVGTPVVLAPGERWLGSQSLLV